MIAVRFSDGHAAVCRLPQEPDRLSRRERRRHRAEQVRLRPRHRAPPASWPSWAAVTPSTPYTSLGTGWNQYDVLTSPGDVNGDRRPDLIARQASTGDVYLYRGTSTGRLAARLKIGSRWTGYKKPVGVGGLNGDGRGALLAQDRSNELWRLDATATSTGGFEARVKVFTDWGASCNAVVGAGDFTGDGRTDMVVRDTSGSLWRLNGNGKGSFGSRVRIATGWQVYRAVG
ncbi:FG-GAP repeat domain-containing protein [Streptomyces sp. NPDC005017]|uniref:FG-GAP repeat domain-containing protein n=1 Tax=Streptomyces sp. NPDC005017 TaxID=3364706 RepID=UPI00369949A4